MIHIDQEYKVITPLHHKKILINFLVNINSNLVSDNKQIIVYANIQCTVLHN